MQKKKESKKAATVGKWKPLFALAVILLISFISFLPVFRNGLLHWDDVEYIQNNPMILSINLKEIFSGYLWGNYHPLTMLAYSIEYQLFGFSEKGYHAVNLLLHLVNVILVFYVIFLLSNKIEIAFVTSLLFGIHPVHVESVAWVAELKDLLYTLFFLSSYILYLKYLKYKNRKFYLFSLLLFILSLFSKAMAVSLPVLLVVTDFFKERKFDRKVWIEKVPFLILSIIFGLVAITAQKSSGAILDVAVFPLPERIVFAGYGFIMYLVKLLIPVHLSAYYPYPVGVGGDIPPVYYGFLLLFTGLIIAAIYSIRFSKKIFFGIFFFFITVFLVLQLLPVGNAIIADRYSYIPSIGIFYLVGEGFYWLWRKKSPRKNFQFVSITILSILVIFFSLKTYSRCSVWKDDMSLWNDVISQYQTVPIAYTNRGNLFLNDKKYDEALSDYNKAIELQPGFTDAYLNRGTLFMTLKRQEEALNDFNKAIELQPDFQKAYNNRGNVLADLKRNDEALRDFNKAIELQAGYTQGYYSRGNFFMKLSKYDDALLDYNKALELQPDFFEVYSNRGLLFLKEKKYKEALSDYNKALELRPNSPEVYYSRGLTKYYSGDKDNACEDLQRSANLEFQPAINLYSAICH